MIKTLFDRLDSWRHLPNYQLERRADVFFSLYLQHVLQSRLGFEISPVIIPEFPVRIGTIYPHIDIDKSYKVDYACFSADKKTVVFVELKTEGQSRRKSQDKYLLASCAIDFSALIEGVIKIFQATQSKHKYFYLLSELAHAGFLTIPAEMCEAIQNDRLLDIRVIVDNIRILKCPQKSKINLYTAQWRRAGNYFF